MEDLQYEALTKRSRVIHGQKHVLPVAVWLQENGQAAVKAPEVGRGLQGRLQSTEILKVLQRLCAIEAIRELPHPGAPHPRVFELVPDHAYWAFVVAMATDATHEYDRASESSSHL